MLRKNDLFDEAVIGPSFSFQVGHNYVIDHYEFKYLRKKGIHHQFKVVNGGWTRTYTDSQLVGKEIIDA